MEHRKTDPVPSRARADYYARMARGIDSQRRRSAVAKLMSRPLTREEEISAIDAFIADKGVKRITLRRDGTVEVAQVASPRPQGPAGGRAPFAKSETPGTPFVPLLSMNDGLMAHR